ncbi:type 1 periplasmic binding fold superfamily protein [Flavobacterium sp.]|uniref:type 1 periplasmic binding fold superfamily protein n=1 Tax=Flavobacterium sp. TaxID=239 RepID=UPI003753C59B
MKNLRINVLAILAIITISSCSKDDEVVPVIPPAVNEVEVLTTVTTVFTPVGGGTDVTLKSRDLDGDGPNAPVITVSGPFALNKTYNGEVSVLDETKTPPENVSAAILTEAVDHQFFYQKTGTLPVFTYTPAATAANNFDSNGKPLGFKTTFVTTTAATGTLTVTLRHQGNKSALNVASGDITNATGATDFAVTYTGLVIQ